MANNKDDSNVATQTTAAPSDEEQREVERLKSPPTGPKPRAKAATALQKLPFGELTWENFEKLCERLVKFEGEPESASRY